MPVMNKSRIEAFSDGVFSIAMTLLVFDIRIPAAVGGVGDVQVSEIFAQLWPLVILFMVSFFVLSVIWTNHHFIFHTFAKGVNRQLNLLNMLYLMFVALVPFSVEFINTYADSKIAAIVYGANLFVIVLLSTMMTAYIQHRKELLNPSLSRRTMNQAQFRARLSLFFYPLGILSSFVWLPASFFFYTFPVMFNIIPGTVDFVEKHTSLNFD